MRHYSSSANDEKYRLRKISIKIRKEFHKNETNSGDTIALNLIKYLEDKKLNNKNLNIAFYLPMGSEINTRPSIAAINQITDKVSIASTEKNKIIFRLWQPNIKIQFTNLGVLLNTKEIKNPNIIICPLIAFDSKCNRLGRGGGFYDKILSAKKNIIKIGFAYSIQKIDKIPMNDKDVKMNAIITDEYIYETNLN